MVWIRRKMATYVSMAIVWLCVLLMVTSGRQLPECPYAFVTAAVCSRDGSLWVATEGGGLLKLPQGGIRWEKQKGNGLPDTVNFLCVAEDRQGRIWAGTDNRGVAVWNGKNWVQYHQSNALLGERVASLAVSPVNGDVAIATSGGLTIYSPATETWQDFTRAEGLPEDQVVSVSFNEKGGLWAAFLTSGIGYASSHARYGDWKLVQTKWYWDEKQRIRQPVDARGKGLPSNLNNAICAAKGGVWVGTVSGLGYGRSASDWKFLRGRDYEKKNGGLWTDRGYRTQKPRKAVSVTDRSLLPEDYITCFHPAPGGMWVGFRESGVCFVRDSSLLIREVDLGLTGGEKNMVHATCFVALPNGSLYVGTYGHGLIPVERTAIRSPLASGASLPPAHPRPPVISQEWEINPLLANKGQRTDQKDFISCYWYEDWATQGDWCERYGRSYAMLCAMDSAMGDVENTFEQGYGCVPWKGPHVKSGDARLKYSVIWSNEPEMRSILYCPESTTRTFALWDDDGENYPRYFDGPDLGAFVEVPEGRHELSLYFYDPRSVVEREYGNGFRDYIIEVRKFSLNFQDDVVMGRMPQEETWFKEYLIKEVENIMELPVLARSRVKSFAGGGVYKNFILNGQGCYYVRIVRNYSTSATLNGIFLSSLDETKAARERYWSTRQTSFWYGDKTPAPPALEVKDLKLLPGNLLASWGNSQNMEEQKLPEIFNSRKQGIYAYRRLLTLPGLEKLKANWRWRLKIWDPGDKEFFLQQMDEAWRGLQDLYPIYRSSEWAGYAPEKTIPFSVAEVKKMHEKNIDWKQYLPNSPAKPERTVEEMKEWLKKH